RRRMEEALRESEAQFRTLANTIPQLCWMANADGGIFWYNERWYSYTGLTPEQMEGWGWQQVHDPTELPLVLAQWKAAIAAGEPVEMVFPLRRNDGEYRTFLTRVMPLRNSDGKLVRWFGTNTDVTEQYRTQEALRDREERLQLAQQAALVGTFEWDVQTGVNRWTPELERLYGLPPGGFAGTQQHWEQLVYPEDREAASRSVQTAIEAGGFEGEWRVIWPDGTQHWLFGRGWLFKDDSGQPLRLIGVNVDITSRKKAEEELRESEARYCLLAEALPAIIFMGLPNGRVEYVNRRWQEYTGAFTRSVDRAAILHPDDYEGAQRAKMVSLESGIPFEMEIRLKRHDGAYRWFRARANPVRDERGQIVKWLGIATDIEDEKLAEGRARESQKMEAIGRLAGGVAHDFNNLLMAISGYSEMALDQLQDNPPLVAHLREVKGATTRAADLTRQLLAFSRRQVNQPRLLNLNTVVDTISKLLIRLIGEDIQLELSLASELGTIRADRTQVDQIIMNLAVNARDAMPNGGRLAIETGNVSILENQPAYGEIPAGDYVVLSVSDTGTGMDEVTKARLFEPFFTTKEEGKGTGLGLAIVYGVVTQSGGSVLVESEPGLGATFRLYFPRSLAVEELDTPTDAVAPSTSSGETVLLVEDEQAVRKLVETMLKRRGYSVLQAATPREAIRLAGECQAPIDVLLSDVLMPEMRGSEVAKRIRALHPGIAVVFMSGYADSTFLDPAALDKAVYMQKPFTSEELGNRIREALDRGRAGQLQ
ncbi:MAG: PAS domain-containing protein, partial [Bryobacteraceae bacterium]